MRNIELASAPVRILHVVTYMGRGGIETMIMNYYRQIDRSKVQFDFLVHREFTAEYDDEIRRMGGKIYRLPKLIPWSVKYRKALKLFFKAHSEYRIIHSHLNCMSAVILKEAYKHGVNVRIAHSHCSVADNPVKLFFRAKLTKYATELFACGKAAGDWMFKGAPYKIINNAIDTSQYAFNPSARDKIRKELCVPSDAFVIGHVGRMSAEKNHVFLLEAFCRVKCINKTARLLLVGDGQLKKELQEKAFELGISNDVIFTGVRGDVPDLMQAMDCFVFPSLFEGLPVAIIEAQAAGLPCLISDGVSAEAAKTAIVERISLSMGADVWAEYILKMYKQPRIDMTMDIVCAGYDIHTNVDFLQNYYVNQWKLDNETSKFDQM